MMKIEFTPQERAFFTEELRALQAQENAIRKLTAFIILQRGEDITLGWKPCADGSGIERLPQGQTIDPQPLFGAK